MTAAEKINLILNHLNINAKAFAESLGYERPQIIYDIQKGKTKRISSELADKIVSVFYDINKSWLLADEGEMLRKEFRNELEDVSTGELEMISDGLQSGKFRMVPLIHIDSVGGVHSDNSIDPSEQYVIRMLPFTEARPGDVAILQSGNSMYPTIPSGSALLIRQVEGWREYFGYGGLYVLWLTDGRRITKEIRRYDPDPEHYVWCVSYNPDIADEELPKSMIRGVWKVIKYIADFGW